MSLPFAKVTFGFVIIRVAGRADRTVIFPPYFRTSYAKTFIVLKQLATDNCLLNSILSPEEPKSAFCSCY